MYDAYGFESEYLKFRVARISLLKITLNLVKSKISYKLAQSNIYSLWIAQYSDVILFTV